MCETDLQTVKCSTDVTVVVPECIFSHKKCSDVAAWKKCLGLLSGLKLPQCFLNKEKEGARKRII